MLPEELAPEEFCPAGGPDLSAACAGVAEITAQLEEEVQTGDPFTAQRGLQLVKELRRREAALGCAAYRQGMLDAAHLSRRLDKLLGTEEEQAPSIPALRAETER